MSATSLVLLIVALVSLLCALIPAILFSVNLTEYVEPPIDVIRATLQPTNANPLVNPASAAGGLPPSHAEPAPAVSILIPARNEAAAIGDAITAALATRNIPFEIVVMDDNSTDGTAKIVQAFSERDSRVRLEQAPPLPPGWNGKQHACWALAHTARSPILCFVDADVRLAPDCVARMAAFLHTSDNALVSGFPRQITVTFLEWLLLPLIHFVLLGFLPIRNMRQGTDPAFAAGCGQFLMARKHNYFQCGGHSEIKLTMHDGLRLPRLFRAAGLRTDLADITNLATCRMYTNARQVWSGLAKNATEGIADPRRIVPVSIVLFLGQVLPLLYVGLVFYWLWPDWSVRGTAPVSLTDSLFLLGLIITAIAAWLPRILATKRFGQDWRSALLHPLGILVLLAIQWYALIRKLAGSPVAWRDRTYTASKL